MIKLPDEVREGEVLAGKYRIDAVVGVGGMGALVAARHLLLGQKVVLKFMLAGAPERDDAVARFVQEARAAIRIHSEHVARVLDVAFLESGVPYIVMEHLDGCDLAASLAKSGPLPLAQAVDYLLEACEAVAEAHLLGIVHRDLKPANLYRSRTAHNGVRIKVLDFGISKNVRLAPETLDASEATPASASTQPRAMLGSPFYMSPEQMESARDVDGRTDIWSLGVTLYELVTGTLPFTGATLIQVYSNMMVDGAPAWKTALGKAAGLEAILGKCLARERRNRFGTVAEFANALAPFGSERATESARRITRMMEQGVVEYAGDDLPVTHRSASDRPSRVIDETPRPVSGPYRPSSGLRRLWLAVPVVGAALAGIALGQSMRKPLAAGPVLSVPTASGHEPAAKPLAAATTAAGQPTDVAPSTSTPQAPSGLNGLVVTLAPQARQKASGAPPTASAALPESSVLGSVVAVGRAPTDTPSLPVAEPMTSAQFDVQKMLESRK